MCLMTRQELGFDYVDLFCSLFSMGRTLKLSRTTSPWSTRRKANQQAWWRTRSRSATSTTAPGTRSQSTLTLIMVSMQWNGRSVDPAPPWGAVLPFTAAGEGRNSGEEKTMAELGVCEQVCSFVSVATPRLTCFERDYSKTNICITALISIRYSMVNASPTTNTGEKPSSRKCFSVLRNMHLRPKYWSGMTSPSTSTLALLGTSCGKTEIYNPVRV